MKQLTSETNKNKGNKEKNKDKEKLIEEKEKENFINKNKCYTVILENLVTMDESSDPTLKTEIAQEAEKYGRLDYIEIVIDQKKEVKIILTYFLCEDAERSYNAMNGRFFGGRTVTAILRA